MLLFRSIKKSVISSKMIPWFKIFRNAVDNWAMKYSKEWLSLRVINAALRIQTFNLLRGLHHLHLISILHQLIQDQDSSHITIRTPDLATTELKKYPRRPIPYSALLLCLLAKLEIILSQIKAFSIHNAGERCAITELSRKVWPIENIAKSRIKAMRSIWSM